MTSNFKKFSQNFLLLAGSVIATVILAEVALRVFDLAPTAGIATVTEEDFRRIPGFLTPNQEVLDRSIPALPYRVRTNYLGYRGEDFPLTKPAGEYRVLMIGDSFTFGSYVDDDQTLPAQLEAALAPLCGNVRVINGGVVGTTIVTHGKMAKRALALDPDLVVLTFFENDLDDLASPPWFTFAENRRRKSQMPLSLVYPVLRHTALWNFAQEVRARLSIRAAADRQSQTDPSEIAAKRSKLRQAYREELVALRDDLLREGIPMILAAFPSHEAFTSSDRREPLQWAIRSASDAGIDTVNLLSGLLGSELPAEKLYLVPHDGHASPRGNAVSAEFLAAHLLGMESITEECERPSTANLFQEVK
ncbi:MAG: SGNH/GDSL hydrolase family protein [bacterium]|nr:MAG: SGNH/GDSL hydrolase family protein [bacterium]